MDTSYRRKVTSHLLPAVLAASLALLCCHCAMTSVNSGAPPASIHWQTERDHDFGTIRQGKPVQFVFRFRNDSDAPLHLETVRTTCGCTAAEWTAEAIAPGSEGQISVEYDAYQRGTFKKKIRVFFQEQKKSEILWIRGAVEE